MQQAEFAFGSPRMIPAEVLRQTTESYEDFRLAEFAMCRGITPISPTPILPTPISPMISLISPTPISPTPVSPTLKSFISPVSPTHHGWLRNKIEIVLKYYSQLHNVITQGVFIKLCKTAIFYKLKTFKYIILK